MQAGAKYTYGETVTGRSDAREELRPGAKAWIVGVTSASERHGSYYKKFSPGVVYTLEFEDGSSIDAHEDEIRLFEQY